MSGVLVVVPCLDEEAHLPALLATLAREAGRALIVVADGGSTDASRRIAADWATRDPRIRLLDNPRRAQGEGINLAVERFGDGAVWLVRVDAHCGYPPDYIAALVRVAVERRATSVVVPMHTVGAGRFQRAVAAAQNSLLGNGGAAHRRVGVDGWVDHGHHALMRLDAFCAAGGYCGRFPHNEDAELDHRLRRAGGRIWLEPSLALDYRPRSTIVALFRQYLNHGRGRARTIRRHRARPRLRQMAPLVVAPAVALLPAGLLAWPLAVPALVWAGGSLGYGLLLGLRARDRWLALAGVAAMTMHLGWSLGFLREWLLGRHPGAEPGPIVRVTSPAAAPR